MPNREKGRKMAGDRDEGRRNISVEEIITRSTLAAMRISLIPCTEKTVILNECANLRKKSMFVAVRSK